MPVIAALRKLRKEDSSSKLLGYHRPCVQEKNKDYGFEAGVLAQW
jgi:hypothetical protein